MARPTANIYTYTIQTSVVPAGTLTVKLHWEDPTNALVVPTFATIVDVGDIVESLDNNPGEYEFQNCTFRYIEDYTNYTEGFWHKVFGAWAEIELVLNEGAGGTGLFYGKIYHPDTSEQEHSITGSGPDYIRTGQFEAISVVYAFEDTPIADLVTDINGDLVARALTINNSAAGKLGAVSKDEYFITLGCLLSSMLHVTFGNTYSEADTIFYWNTTSDLQYYCNSAWKDVDEIHLYWGNEDDDECGKWDSADDFYIGNYANNCLELLRELCHSFQIVIRLVATGAGAFTFHVFNRASSFAATTFDVPIESSMVRQSYTEQKYMILNNYTPGSADPINSYLVGPVGYHQTAPSDWMDNIDFELEINKHFEATEDDGDYWAATYAPFWIFLANQGANTLYASTDIRWWDYVTSAYIQVSADAATFGAQARVMYGKLSDVARGYRRVYHSLKGTRGTTTHTNVHVGIMHQIDDGVDTRNYYAVEVRKNVFANRLTVLWNEI